MASTQSLIWLINSTRLLLYSGRLYTTVVLYFVTFFVFLFHIVHLGVLCFIFYINTWCVLTINKNKINIVVFIRLNYLKN